jgi:signal peptidase I
MKKSVVREYLESFLIAVILALFVRTWVFQAFKIPSGSMEPNLLIGDHLIVNKMEFAPTASALERVLLPRGDVRRGDVIVFKYPADPERDFIKRVVGLPGERVELRERRVLINGQPIDDPHARYPDVPGGRPPRPGDVRDAYGPVTVPERQYFVMGDNRDNSEDSRYWGFLPASYVKGRALFIYFSIQEGASVTHLAGGIRWGRLFDRVR